MKILLIDADSKIPNIPLMKLSTFHKGKGDLVVLNKLNITCDRRKKKKLILVDTSQYDIIYCSVVFESSINWIDGNRIIYGGTGYKYDKPLPNKIELLPLDYSIYPENDTSYGFISRGCIRKCSFCKVPKKEGYIRQVNTVKGIIRHKQVKFLDNNFLALPNHEDILMELINIGIKCQFYLGLDIRLITICLITLN